MLYGVCITMLHFIIHARGWQFTIIMALTLNWSIAAMVLTILARVTYSKASRS
jgi:hypothetical protein